MYILLFSEMSVNVYQSTRRDIPEDVNLHQQRCDDLKLRIRRRTKGLGGAVMEEDNNTVK
jgi:hypothetical protein